MPASLGDFPVSLAVQAMVVIVSVRSRNKLGQSGFAVFSKGVAFTETDFLCDCHSGTREAKKRHK